MKKLTIALTTALFVLASGVAHADPADPADVILGNDGEFNAAPALCLMADGYGLPIGQCVKWFQENIVEPPACDGNLRSDSLECGSNTETP